MIQEFLLVSWHCVSRTLQTRSSPPLRNAGEWWIHESQTPKLYTVRSKWMPGCLETPSQETNSKIEQKLWSSYGLASHTDRRGRAHVCYLTTQVRHELFSQRQHRSGEMIPAWTGPAKSCWCWPATEREATKSGPFQTPPCFTGSTITWILIRLQSLRQLCTNHACNCFQCCQVHSKISSTIFTSMSSTGGCLTSIGRERSVTVRKCDGGSRQIWQWKKILKPTLWEKLRSIPSIHPPVELNQLKRPQKASGQYPMK